MIHGQEDNLQNGCSQALFSRDRETAHSLLQPLPIWMDMCMPVVDGHQATRTIRKLKTTNNSKFKVQNSAHQLSIPPTPNPSDHTTTIALTASAFEDRRAEMIAAGCNDFVRKPLYGAEICRKMTDNLRGQFELKLSGVSHHRATQADSVHSSLEAIQKLPQAWRRHFHQAAIQADRDWLRSLLATAGGARPTQARTVSTDYPARL